MSATTITVDNCADSGTGSLRSVIGSVATQSGDTIDLSHLACSSISLTTGAITVAQQSLVLQGPVSGIAVSGKNNGSSRVFYHTGYGILSLEHIDVVEGHAVGVASVRGGCIDSKGSLFLYYASVSQCSLDSITGYTYGGGVATRGSLTLTHSTIRGNHAGAMPGSKVATGGGAFVGGNLVMSYSTVADNTSNSAAGGVYASSGAFLFGSTVSGNQAYMNAGFAVQSGHPATDRVVITDSTISDNVASGTVGGVYSNTPLNLQNSTIAFNTAVNATMQRSAGLMLSAVNGAITADLQSSILANNTIGGVENDFAVYNTAVSSVTTTGANVLIGKASSVVPIGTTYGKCPLLGPLRNNGGPTRTHALLSHSPAIDAGNDSTIDPLTMAPYPNDQRGVGYTRVDHGQADMGAYEVQQADVVFNAGFDGCDGL